jgi:hypothetical protein
VNGYRRGWEGTTPGMGWMHDHHDVSYNRRRSANEAASMEGTPGRSSDAVEANRLGSQMGIPGLVGRRARWMTARLRHVRND